MKTPARRPKGRPDAAAAPAAPVIDDVEDLLASASDDRHLLWIWRQRDGDWALLEKVSPAALRAQGVGPTVQEKFGGGRYKARLRERGGAWGQSRQFTIEGEPKSSTPAPAPIVAAESARASSFELPSWVEKIVLPIAVALGAGITNKLLADPKTDPLVLELIKRGNRSEGGSVDPIALQRLLQDAETRGETRGRELGSLRARASSDHDSGGGVLAAAREFAPVIGQLLSERQRVDQAPPPAIAAGGAPLPSAHTTDPMPAQTAPDIVPAWLRPFVRYKGLLIDVADRGKNPSAYSDLVMDVAEDDRGLFNAMQDARTAGRLEADLFAAIPELQNTAERRTFAAELVSNISEALAEMASPESESVNG